LCTHQQAGGRPVMVIGNEIFIGNAPKVTAAMVAAAKGA
jgi:hypothetical protein